MSEIIIASVATWKPLGTSSRSVLFIQQSQTGEKGNHECYRSIVPDAQFSLTVPDLITKQIMRNESRHILSIITRFRTGYGSSKEWFERFHLPQDSQECECGDLKTIRHILIVCVWYNDLRQKLKRVSPALDLSVLFNTKQGFKKLSAFGNRETKASQHNNTAAKVL